MSEAQDIWHNRYFVICKFYLGIFGIWPYHKFAYRCARFVIIFIFNFSTIIPQILYFTNGPIGAAEVFECVPMIIVNILLNCKLVLVMLNSDKVKVCFDIMQKDWLSLNTNAERAILQRHSDTSCYITKCYVFGMHILVCFYMFKPVMLTVMNDNSVNLTRSSIPSASKLPILVEYGPTLNHYFYLIAVHCYVTIYFRISILISIESLYCILIQHACGMFSVVGYVLENVGKDNGDNFELKPDKVRDGDYATILHCLRRHLYVIEFAENIESIYTNIFLVTVYLNVIGGSLIGIEMLLNLNNTMADLVSPLSIYIAQYLYLFVPFWQAQSLLNYSTLPYESICRANWYHTSKRCQKLYLLIMNRTMSTCKITAGRIMTLSIENFGAVVKASFSYLALFRSFQ